MHDDTPSNKKMYHKCTLYISRDDQKTKQNATKRNEKHKNSHKIIIKYIKFKIKYIYGPMYI